MLIQVINGDRLEDFTADLFRFSDMRRLAIRLSAKGNVIDDRLADRISLLVSQKDDLLSLYGGNHDNGIRGLRIETYYSPERLPR